MERRPVSTEVADAAFEIATGGGAIVVNGKRESVWRMRDDGVIEVARPSSGCVELFEVHADTTSQLVATSPRSPSKVAATICAYLTALFFVAGVVGMMAGVTSFAVFLLLAVLTIVSFFVLRGSSDVRPWVRARFGGDEDWADVPWMIYGAPPTGNQKVALTTLLGRGVVRYRVLADDNLEVVVRGKEVEVIHVDVLGVPTVTQTLPTKRFKLHALRGRDTTWHQIVVRDPSD